MPEGSWQDKIEGVQGLTGAFTLTVSPEGANVYVTGAVARALAVFSRDPATGALTFLRPRSVLECVRERYPRGPPRRVAVHGDEFTETERGSSAELTVGRSHLPDIMAQVDKGHRALLTRTVKVASAMSARETEDPDWTRGGRTVRRNEA